jgi:hypothetical protein
MKGILPFIFDDFHFCRSRVIGLDMTENRIFTLCRMITWVVFLRMVWNFISTLPVKRGGSLSTNNFSVISWRELVLLWAVTKIYSPLPTSVPTYFHNQNITDCSDQKWKGWVVFFRMFWNFISRLPMKRGGSLSFLTIFTFAVPELLDLIWQKIGFLPYVVKNPIFRHIKSNNSGMAKVKIVKKERDPPLFTRKLLIKF